MNNDIVISIEEYENAKEYWLNKLSGEINKMELHTDYTLEKHYISGQETINFSNSLSNKLLLLSKNKDVLLYVILLSALNILMSRYTRNDDVIIAAPAYHGMGDDNEYIVFRSYVDKDITYKQYLANLKRNVIEGYKNQFYPMERIFDNLKLKKFGISLLKVALAFDNIHDKRCIDSILDTNENDIMFSVKKDGNCLKGNIIYNTNYYKSSNIQSMANVYTYILEQLMADINIGMGNVELVSLTEKHQILDQFNNTNVEYRNCMVHVLFEEQQEKTPNRIAVEFEDKSLTYKELNDKANQLARVLINNGVGENIIVGILLEHSIELIISILAVLKAGGAYLPIDTEYPQQRIENYLTDSKAKVLLTLGKHVENIKFSGTVIDLNDNEWCQGENTNLNIAQSTNSMAYVIYTSGSTGTPKGVMIKHSSVSNYVQWRIKKYNINQSDVTLQLLSPAFDAFGSNLYSTILSGGKLVMTRDIFRHDNDCIINLIKSKKITNMSIVPSMYRILMKDATNDTMNTLRFIVFGGEKIDESLFNLSKMVSPGCTLINEYGPTENTIATTAIVGITADTILSIGSPISNNEVYILDKELRIVPVGVPGELCVSGMGLARGYLNKTDLTMEKFIPNPFRPDKIMYRTGDLARWLKNGTIEYIGRLDCQVKIRGNRIELNEIENVIMNMPHIEHAVVIDREDEEGNKYLSSYLKSNEDIDVEEVREYIGKRLPGYMIPSNFFKIDDIPLTSNGKVDRKKLKLMEIDKMTNLRVEYIAPQNDIEYQMCKIWQDILSVEKVGIKDNFFTLGGHSLKATLLMSKIYKELGVEIPLAEIFNNPTIEKMVGYIQHCEKRQLTTIKPIDKQEYYQVSSAQKRMYVLNEMCDVGTSYNIPLIMTIEGVLDKTRFQEAINKLVQRHETLRTCFRMIDGELMQKICNCENLDIVYSEAKPEEIDGIINNFIQVFDLNQAPLMRVQLVKLEDMKHIFMVDMHHIITDGLSVNIFIKEFIELYEGKNLQPLTIQYKDFAVWQAEMLKTEEAKKQEAYWMKLFSGGIPTLDMPTDFIRPAVQSFKGDTVVFEIEKELVSKLKNITEETSTTLYMILLAAYNVMLAKYTGQEDIIVGSPIASRRNPDVDNMIGLFVNTLAMRNYPKGDLTFREFINQVKTNAINAYNNQDYQFEDLIGKLELRRDLSRNTLFDTMFIMQNFLKPEIISSENKFSMYDYKKNTTKFDISLEALEIDDHIRFNIDYCTELFSRQTIERMAGHYVNIIKQIVNNIDVKLTQYRIISNDEKEQILSKFNNTKVNYGEVKIICELFEEQVEKNPEHIAVIVNDEELTYKELNKRVNQLARLLVRKGVGADVIVGIMLERSAEMLIGIMAILKAGGAYLPIDPTYPEERINYICKDSCINILLVKEEIKQHICYKGEVINIADSNLYQGDDSNLYKVIGSNNLAYVIYTSGSTGLPKGTMIEHGSLTNRLLWMQGKYKIGEGDIVLQKTSFTFDVSVWELLWWSFTGASVCFLASGGEKDPETIVNTIQKNNITIIHFVPSMLNMFLYYLETTGCVEKVACLRKVFASGESLSINQVYRFNGLFGQNSNISLYNLYGPTEATIDVSYFECPKEHSLGVVPIGKPIDNIRLYILNSELELQPIGIKGEIYIAGVGVARGYLNKDKLTKERFMDDVFVSGDRMYKTGDLARWLPDGNIEFIGRCDYQVKIRGFRIELGEIEKTLTSLDGINEAIVNDGFDKLNNHYLCAYITKKAKASAKYIRDCLLKKLPDYMVPQYYVTLDEFPLTHTGKVNRKALPEPDEVNTERTTEYIAPRNNVEENLVQVWQQVLGINTVGINDDFFMLGGDSIKAIQIVNRIREFGLKLEISEIFRNPTIGELSGIVQVLDSKSDQSVMEGEIALTPIQHWFFNMNFTDMQHYNQSVLLYREERFDADIIKNVFHKIVEHHDSLRMVFNISEGKILQKSRGLSEEVFNFEIIDMMNEVHCETKMNMEAERLQASIDLEKGPLVKLELFKTMHGDYLLIVIHHLVIDSVSWRILLEDFQYGYTCKERGDEITLPDKTDSYKVWSNALQAFGKSQMLLKDADYWNNISKAHIATLPKQKVIQSRKVKDEETLGIVLSVQETENLIYNTNYAYNTDINDILLTALGIAMRNWMDDDGILINLEGHGREKIADDLDISRTVGWFTMMYPVLLNVKDDEDIGYNIKMMKENLHNAHKKGIGYGVLKYIANLQAGNNLIQDIEPEICFNYLGQLDKEQRENSFTISKMNYGMNISSDSERRYALDINGAIENKKFNLDFTYDVNEFSKENILVLVKEYEKAIKMIIDHCKGKQSKEETPSDFKHDNVSFEELENIKNELKDINFNK